MAMLVWSQVHGLTSLMVAKPSAPWPDLDVMVDLLLDVVRSGIT